MTTPTEPSVEASEAVGALAAVIATPSEGGSVYVAHAQIREALAAHILAAGWTSPADHERAVRQARAEALRDFAEYARQMGGPMLAPGCPGYAELAFWRRAANEADAYQTLARAAQPEDASALRTGEA